jgi:hypothetical protein
VCVCACVYACVCVYARTHGSSYHNTHVYSLSLSLSLSLSYCLFLSFFLLVPLQFIVIFVLTQLHAHTTYGGAIVLRLCRQFRQLAICLYIYIYIHIYVLLRLKPARYMPIYLCPYLIHTHTHTRTHTHTHTHMSSCACVATFASSLYARKTDRMQDRGRRVRVCNRGGGG